MRKVKLMFIAMILGLSTPLFAHEGHDATPGSVPATQGGVVHGVREPFLEVTTDSSGLQIYPLTDEGKLIPVKDVKIKGTYLLYKRTRKQTAKEKKQTLDLSPEGDHFIAKVKAQDATRYDVDLEIVTYRDSKKSEKIKTFPVEIKP